MIEPTSDANSVNIDRQDIDTSPLTYSPMIGSEKESHTEPDSSTTINPAPIMIYRRVEPGDVENIAAFLQEPLAMDDDIISTIQQASSPSEVDISTILDEIGFEGLLGDFLKRSIVADINGYITHSNLHRAASAYLDAVSGTNMTSREFSYFIAEFFIFPSRVKNTRIYPGIQWRSDTTYRPNRIKTRHLVDIERVE